MPQKFPDAPNKHTNRVQLFRNNNREPPVIPQLQSILESEKIPEFRYNTILVVCDQLLNFKNIPAEILKLMPGYQAFKTLGIQFDNIYNNRQDCSPSRGSFVTSQLNVNISDNIDQSWQYLYNPQLATTFDTIGKSMKRNGYETVWYGKNHWVSSIAPSVTSVPAFNTNTRGCLRDYGYDIYNTFGDTYYYNNEGIFSDNSIFELKVNYDNDNVDFVDSTGKYIGAIPYLKARSKNDKAFHLELHLENPHDTQHFWQNFAQIPAKSQIQLWAPYINEQIALLKSQGLDVSNPFNFSDSFPDATIQNPNLIKNYFEKIFEIYRTSTDTLPFKESYTQDYVLDPSSNNSQFPYFIGMMSSLQGNTTIPTDKDDIMSWKNLINNYYGLLIESDNYIYKLFLLLKNSNMLRTTSVAIISDHGDMMSSHGMKQKGYHFENSCNVACLIYSPYIPLRLRGSRSNVLGSLLDIAPTIETLANIRQTKSDRFLGKSLLNWEINSLIPRVQDEPVFNIYTAWMSYLTYFSFKSWTKENPDNSILPAFNSSNFYNYQAFFVMTIDYIEGKKYKLAKYFNFIEVLEYQWLFDERLNKLQVTAANMKTGLTDSDINLPLLISDIEHTSNLIDSYFTTNTWSFKTYYKYIVDNTDANDNLILVLALIPIINITIDKIKYSCKMPGYYNKTSTYTDTIYSNFNAFYNDPDDNFYFFMYNLDEDPNELTNLLDKAYPERQTTDVLNKASLMSEKINLLTEKYQMVYFDFIIPTPVFYSLALNLKIHKDKIDEVNASKYESCFGLNKTDGDKMTQPYYDKILSMLNSISTNSFNV